MNLTTRIAVIVTITLVGLVMRFFLSGGRLGSAAGRAAAELDQICAESLAAPNKCEAREWCQRPSSMGFEMSCDEMLELAEQFYTAGAERVYVTDIENVGEKNMSASMVVVLPADGAARKGVFAAEAKFAEKIGEEPLGDVGQKYVLLALD